MKQKMNVQEKSWVLYDWANSVYATIMMAAVFPIYFTSIAKQQGMAGDYWWSLGTSIAMAAIAICAPIIGAFADYKNNKKRLFSAFLIIGLLFTFFAAIFNNWILLLLSYMISHIGFSGSCLVYDSFLTDVTSIDRMDKISSYGFAFGYIGGSTIPFMISIALLTFGEKFGIDTTLAVRISVIITVLWWGLFSIPFLRNVKQHHWIERPKSNTLKNTFNVIADTAKSIYQNKKVFFFILAYFFYIDGVGTVINMSTSYGAVLGLKSTSMILALMMTQFVAFPCAILFSKFSEKFGSINMLIIAVCEYFLICSVGFIMGFGLEEGFLSISSATILFWVLAFMVGTVQGGIQAISRSYFGKLIPPEKSGEYFGFFDIFGKFAAVIGPALYAITRGITGRSSFSILSLIILFSAGLVLLIFVRAKENQM